MILDILPREVDPHNLIDFCLAFLAFALVLLLFPAFEALIAMKARNVHYLAAADLLALALAASLADEGVNHDLLVSHIAGKLVYDLRRLVYDST